MLISSPASLKKRISPSTIAKMPASSLRVARKALAAVWMVVDAVLLFGVWKVTVCISVPFKGMEWWAARCTFSGSQRAACRGLAPVPLDHNHPAAQLCHRQSEHFLYV